MPAFPPRLLAGLLCLVSIGCSADEQHQPRYTAQEVGTCDAAAGSAFIETADDCVAAATALGLPDVKPTVLTAEVTASATMPHGCYHKASNHADTQLWFNEAGMNDSTDTERVSICGEFRAVAPSLDATATLRLDL